MKKRTKKGLGESYKHHNCLPMEKFFLKNAHTRIFWQKDTKGGLFRGFKRQGRRRIWVLLFQHLKLGPICDHLQKDSWRSIKKIPLASSKTAAPFYSGSASTLTSFLSSGSVRKCPNFFFGNPFVFGVLQDRVSSRARHCQQDDCSKHGFLKLAQPDPLNWTIVHCKYCY